MSAAKDKGAGVVPAPVGPSGAHKIGLGLLVAGLALSGAAAATDLHRFGFAWLWGFAFLWTVVIGGLFFVGLQHLTHAVWSIVLRRVAEMIAAPMWVVGLLFLPVVGLGLFAHEGMFPWADAAHVAADHVLHAKAPYLNVPFFLARAAFFFLLWIGFTRYYLSRSLGQDDGSVAGEASEGMRKASGPFIILFGWTATFASIDWLQSIEPHWFSTIFGVYTFAGIVVSSLAAITLATFWLLRSGRLGDGVVRSDHIYSLGALMFAFTVFWGYIAFSQYMLIWYANMPEESFYLVHRLSGSWLPVSVALGVLRFVVPFILLLSRRAKTNPGMLIATSWIILVGQLLDMYWIIMPEAHDAPVLSWQEIGPPLVAAGVLVTYSARFLARHRAMAVGDPLLEQSRHFHL